MSTKCKDGGQCLCFLAIYGPLLLFFLFFSFLSFFIIANPFLGSEYNLLSRVTFLAGQLGSIGGIYESSMTESIYLVVSFDSKIGCCCTAVGHITPLVSLSMWKLGTFIYRHNTTHLIIYFLVLIRFINCIYHFHLMLLNKLVQSSVHSHI